jgi:flagellar hook-basal body complex protein FliE
MTIEAISFLPPAIPIAPDLALGHASMDAAGGVTGRPFAEWMGSQVQQANGKLVESEKALQALASGDASSLHHVMISMEEARLGFQLVSQVRSRVLEAYQEVMRMQI